jgi:hypothetical protein
MAHPGGHRPRRNRGRLFNIDLINQLEAGQPCHGRKLAI